MVASVSGGKGIFLAVVPMAVTAAKVRASFSKLVTA
jgi:hypothetical protein